MFNDGGQDTRVVTVVSGKGGVGKSVLAVNLATTLASGGRRVALLDADIGQGSCAYLVGPGSPVQLITPDPELDPADALDCLESQLILLRSQADLILIDAPAGIGPTVRWALDRADAGLLVLVDEPTAVADAYALAKLTWHHDSSYPLAGVVNMVDSALEAADVMERFSALTSHFLDRKILYGGWVPFSGAVRASVRKQIPAIGESMAVARAFEDLAGRVRCGLFQTLAPLAMN
ncbi:MAG: flagellar biosynthesis protein FlhG [Rhodothermales bacterium]|jgi:flagellar biosynthesis protein FlhG